MVGIGRGRCMPRGAGARSVRAGPVGGFSGCFDAGGGARAAKGRRGSPSVGFGGHAGGAGRRIDVG
jgi:hypothetical protein